MNTLLRRIRGLAGVALTWGAGFAAFMMVLWTVIWIVAPRMVSEEGEGILRVATIIGGVGVISGLVFGGLMSIAETRKKILELSTGRAALWGMTAAAVFPLLTGRADQVFWTGPLGALLAAGSVALARRAELRNPTITHLTDNTASAYTQEVSSKELHR